MDEDVEIAVAGCLIICLLLFGIVVIRNHKAGRCTCCNSEGDEENLIIDDSYEVSRSRTSFPTIPVSRGYETENDAQLSPPLPHCTGQENFRPNSRISTVVEDFCINPSHPTPSISQDLRAIRVTTEIRHFLPTTSTQRLPFAEVRKNSSRGARRSRLSQNRVIKPTGLIIAVDATPSFIGGYCIDPFQGVVEYYSASSSRMPWSVNLSRPNGNSTEFEMKNLLCALLLWADTIMTHKRVSVYTDNNAINGRRKYANRVHNFLKHLKLCEGVVVGNLSKMYVNSRKDKGNFNNFITPADHLSRRREDEFVAHFNQGPWKDRLHKVNFAMINRPILKWTRRECSKCGFHIENRGSLKSIPIFRKTFKSQTIGL